MTFFPADSRQALRLRRSLMAGGAALVLSVLVWIAGEYRLVRLQQSQIAWLLVAFWIVNFVFFAVLRSGLNLRFRDPSLTVPQIVWATSCVLFIIYFVYDVRAAFLLICALVINFGAFRLNFLQLIGLSVYAILGYALVIYLLHLHHPQTFGLQLELFLLAGFAAALLGSALVGHEMYVLRLTLRERNRQVREVLEQVKELAVTDELTGIHNRRYIVDVLERQAALAQRGDYRFSICFFDLDHFKQVNDTHGHAAGDRVLIKVAQIATEATRVGDYVARYGGEEFVIVLSATGVERALSVAERIRESAEGTSFDELGPDVRVTISCGVTEYRAPEAVHELLVRADEAMYAAKNRGRNTVVES